MLFVLYPTVQGQTPQSSKQHYSPEQEYFCLEVKSNANSVNQADCTGTIIKLLH